MGMLNHTRAANVCPCRDCAGGEDYGTSKWNRFREKREWLRDVRDELAVQQDEGDLYAMLDEHHEWADTRVRANIHLLRES